MKRLRATGVALLVAQAAVPIAAHAESTFATGAGSPITAAAHLDFTIVVPKFIYARVGTGANMATDGSIDNIVYTVAAANVGTGTAVAGVGGDLTGGVVTARVMGNNGAITFGSTTTGPLSDGAGDTISYAQISATAATNTSVAILAHPALADGATTNETLPNNISAKVTNIDAKWTFSYLNTNIVPPGTYGGVNLNAGRVVYTASMP
ncbi:MAG: hypothetical protein ACYC8V_01200 [Caulobacteraceae bacterium]